MCSRAFGFFILAFLLNGCASLMLESQVEAQSNASLCYSMVYKKKSLSNHYFKLMVNEALTRDLNCKLIAKDILDFRQKITGISNNNFYSSNSSPTEPSDGINPITARAPK